MKAHDIQANFFSSLNSHDGHVQAWVEQLDEMHPRALLERLRQAEHDSFGNAWEYWMEVDKDTPVSPSDQAPALTITALLPVVHASNNPAPQPPVVPLIPISKRRDLLAPLIESAQRLSSDPYDASHIWGILCGMAEAQTKPLKGKTEDGIQWISGDDEVMHLSLRNLRDRLARKNKRRGTT